MIRAGHRTSLDLIFPTSRSGAETFIWPFHSPSTALQIPALTVLMPRFRRATLEIASDYARQLRRIAVPRRLVREALKPIAVRRDTWERSDCGLQGGVATQGPEILWAELLSAL